MRQTVREGTGNMEMYADTFGQYQKSLGSTPHTLRLWTVWNNYVILSLGLLVIILCWIRHYHIR